MSEDAANYARVEAILDGPPAPSTGWRTDEPPRDGRTVWVRYRFPADEREYSWARSAGVARVAWGADPGGREGWLLTAPHIGAGVRLEQCGGPIFILEAWTTEEPAVAPAPPSPRTNAQTLALLRLGLEDYAPEPLPGPYRAVESPDTPGHWRILGPRRGQILAVLPGFGVDPERMGATARAMAAGERLLDLAWQARETLAAAAKGEDIQQAALHLLDRLTAEIDRVQGQGYTVDAAAGTILCHWCGLISHHPEDVAQGYCGRCHTFLDFRGGEAPARG